MTQKTKLEIIGEYREDHPGPFCTRDGRPVRVITHTDGTEDNPVVYAVDGERFVKCADNRGHYTEDGCTGAMPSNLDLMCAREVPVAREFWVNEYTNSALVTHNSLESARKGANGSDFIQTIHMIEVLPGEGV